VIIVNVNGGLGNQMFQYALGRALSLSKKTKLRLYVKEVIDKDDHNGFELDNVFNISASIATNKDRKLVLGSRSSHKLIKLLRSKKLDFLRGGKYIVEKSFNYQSDVFDISDNIFIRGFWQSEKYFLEYRNTILQEFSFKSKLSEKNLAIKKQVQSCISVSIHVRRGDYISNPSANKVHGVLSEDYYKRAIDKLDIDGALFVFFSDDANWVKNYLAPIILNSDNFIVVDHNHANESYNDMRLMSLCEHNIIANSSFSWWGAWLNTNPNKIVIAPKNWFSIDKNTSDLIPQSWIQV
jgi:hypothetical protein